MVVSVRRDGRDLCNDNPETSAIQKPFRALKKVLTISRVVDSVRMYAPVLRTSVQFSSYLSANDYFRARKTVIFPETFLIILHKIEI